MNELKNKSLRYQIGYWFFLIAGISGASFQMYKYFIGTLELTFPEFAVTLLFGIFVFKPMFLTDAFNAIIKFKTK